MKGKIPVTSMITLESEKAQWQILIKGLISELKTTALIEIDSTKKVRINLIITRIIPPKYLRHKTTCSVESNMGEQVASGVSRTKEFIIDFLDGNSYLFMGFIDGEEKIPILIVHYESINITVYTQKLKTEETKKFFPDHHLN